MKENLVDFSIIVGGLATLLVALISGVTLEALLANITVTIIALIIVAILIKKPKAAGFLLSKLTPPEGPMRILTAPEGPMRILTTPEEPMRILTAPEEPMRILTTPEEPMRILTTPEEPMRILTTPEEPMRIEKDVLGVLAHQEAVLLWGQKGSGKTTLLLAIASKRKQLGHQIYVCDPHACPNKWDQANVVGGGRNYEQIEQFLLQIEGLMDKRYKEIYKGDVEEGEHAHISIIIDEYRSIVTKTDECSGVIKTLLTEARKANIWLVVVSHSPTVQSLGFKGEAVLKEGLAIAHLQKQRTGKRLVNIRLNGEKPFSLPLPNYGSESARKRAEAGGSGAEAGGSGAEAGGSGAEAGGSGAEAGGSGAEAGGSGAEVMADEIVRMFLGGMSQKQIIKELFDIKGGRRYKEASEKINNALRGALA